MAFRLKTRHLSFANRVARGVWAIVRFSLFRPTPRNCHRWRAFLLRMFGAKLAHPVYVYPSCRIWAPWNLEMGAHSTLSEDVDCYSVEKIKVGAYATVSQYSFLCTASHDYLDPAILTQPQMPLIAAPIVIGERVWIAADVFVAPGVTIGNGTVVLARSTALHDLVPWIVAAGTPAKVLRHRELHHHEAKGTQE